MEQENPRLAFEDEIRARLAGLEARVRLWKRLTLALAATMVVAVATAMAAPGLNILTANEIKIVDAQGKDRIVLSADPDRADITLFDPSGKSRLTLDVAKDRRPILSFSNETGKESNRLVLGLEDEGHPGLLLYDAKGRKRVAFGIPKEGGPVIRVLDENEKLQMRFP